MEANANVFIKIADNNHASVRSIIVRSRDKTIDLGDCHAIAHAMVNPTEVLPYLLWFAFATPEDRIAYGEVPVHFTDKHGREI